MSRSESIDQAQQPPSLLEKLGQIGGKVVGALRRRREPIFDYELDDAQQSNFYHNIDTLRSLIETPNPSHPYYFVTNRTQVQAAQLVRQFPHSSTGVFIYRLKSKKELDFIQIFMKMGNGPMDLMSFQCYIDENGDYVDINASRMDFDMTTEKPENVRIDDLVIRYSSPAPQSSVNFSDPSQALAFMTQFNNGMGIVMNDSSEYVDPSYTQELCVRGSITN